MHNMLTLQEALSQNLKDATPHDALAMLETLEALANACAQISDVAAQGVLAGAHGLADSDNSQGEAQKKLDVLSDELMSSHLADCPHVEGWASEEHERQQVSPDHARKGRYLVV